MDSPLIRISRLVALVLVLGLWANALAQQAPPGWVEFNQARTIKDPAKRIKSLQQIMERYPDSPIFNYAALTLIETHAGMPRVDPEQITAIANRVIVRIAPAFKPQFYNAVAWTLTQKGVALEVAEQFAKDGLALLDQYDETPQIAMIRASLHQIRARICIDTDRLDEAQAFLDQAAATDPDDSELLFYQGRLAEKRGDRDAAFEAYLTSAARGNAEALPAAQALYIKRHGSEAGLEERLDEKIRAKGFHFDPGPPYKPGGAVTGKVVLAELFTGSECPPCFAADHAFDGLSKHFNRNQVAIIEYHLHIPRPDPMANTDTETRAAYYGVNSTPTAIFDGGKPVTGGGMEPQVIQRFQDYKSEILKRLATKPDYTLHLEGRRTADQIRVKARVPEKSTAAGDDLRLHLVLVEEEVHYTGHNGIHFHHYVVRKLLNGPAGTTVRLTTGQATSEVTLSVSELEKQLQAYLDGFESKTGYTFPVKTSRIKGPLGLVAFIQSQASKTVYQAAYLPLK